MATKKAPVTTAKTEEKETAKAGAQVTVKEAETLKIEAKKREEPKKIEAVTPVALVERKEEAPKKRAGRKTSAKAGTAAGKEAAKAGKAAKTTTRKTAAAKAEKKTEEIILQFGGREINGKDLTARVNAIWTEELGKKAKDLKELRIYVKPEEYMAYYVINGDITGSFDL